MKNKKEVVDKNSEISDTRMNHLYRIYSSKLDSSQVKRECPDEGGVLDRDKPQDGHYNGS